MLSFWKHSAHGLKVINSNVTSSYCDWNPVLTGTAPLGRGGTTFLAITCFWFVLIVSVPGTIRLRGLFLGTYLNKRNWHPSALGKHYRVLLPFLVTALTVQLLWSIEISVSFLITVCKKLKFNLLTVLFLLHNLWLRLQCYVLTP